MSAKASNDLSAPAARRVGAGWRLFPIGLLPPPALCLVALGLLPLVLLLVGQAALVRYLFPLLALALAGYLYVKSPQHYLGLCLWLFLLTPFVRRLVDAQIGWLQVNPVMLAPYLASSLMFFTVVAYLLRADFKTILPFVLIFASVAYGFVLSAVDGYIVSGGFDALRWCTPVFAAVFVLHHRRLAEELRSTVVRCFAWALPLLGLYGLLQFFSPMPWDLYWINDVDSYLAGRPRPYEIRVFSTMNSPQSFAIAAAVGLILIAAVARTVLWVTAAPGLIALLLTLSRSVIGGFVVGVLYLLVMSPRAVRARVGLFALATACVLVPALLAVPQLRDRLTHRFEQTMTLEDDASANSRMSQYAVFPVLMQQSVLGSGLAWKGDYAHLDDKQFVAIDSGIIETMVGLGVIAGSAYFIGFGICLVRLGQVAISSNNPFVHACAAIAICGVTQLPLQHVLIGEGGFMIWPFIGLGLAHGRSRRRRSTTGTRTRRSQRISVAPNHAQHHGPVKQPSGDVG